MRYIAVAIGALFLLAGQARASTYVVDQGGSGDFLTIQAAVNIAQDGDTVLVHPGLYQENVHFPQPAPAINLLGDGPATTTIDAGGADKCIVIVDWTGGGGVVSGFTLQNSGTGYSGTYLNSGIVIDTAGTGSWTVSGNTFRDHPNTSLLMFDATLVESNLFVNGGSWASVFVSQDAWATISGNDFVNCQDAVQAHVQAVGLTAMGNIVAECDVGFQIGAGVLHTLGCNDLWNVGQEYVGCSPGAGDFYEDPLFCDPEQGDFTLNADSPCLPGNHPQGEECGLVGAYPQGCGYTAVQAVSWGTVKAQYLP